MNNWHISGNLGADAEVRHTAMGDAITNFKVAVSSGYGDKKQTIWTKCSIFGKRGKSLLPYLKKGQRVELFGELGLNKWTDKEGQERQDIAINVHQLELAGSKPENKGKPSPDDLGDDVPF